jgi:dTDP-4-amino-4,6-dideoxygalactose transaminase
MSVPPASGRAIAFSRPWFDEREETRVREALSGRVAGDGPFCRRVEKRLSSLLAGRRVLLTTSCTHAMELALLALGVGPGQEVVCPSYTFVSTANAVLRVGARPVFADIEETTLGLDPEDVERRLSPRATALIPVHYAGVAPDMEALLEIARRRRLHVIEDAAQALGAAWRGRALGTLGDAGCFSFHETKNVTCGEGGALALADPEVAGRAEIVREKGTNRSAFLRGEVDKYTWVAEGSSYVLSDVLAAILDAQLDKWEEIQSRRAAVVARYRSGLRGWAEARGVRLPPELPERRPNHHVFYLLYPEEGLRDAALTTLRARGVAASFHYVPLHSAPQGRAIGGTATPLPVTDRVAGRLLRLPLHPRLSEDEVDYVIGAVRGTGGGG